MRLAIAGIAAAWGLIALPALAQQANDADAPTLRADEIAQTGSQAGSQAEAQPETEADAIAAAAAASEAEAAAALAEARSAAAAAAAALPGGVDDRLIHSAADYALFQRELAALMARPIEEPVDLDAVMDTLAGYDSRTLNDAWMGYAALIAAQHPVFVERVREIADYYGPNELVQGMINEPDYVLSFPGAREAAAIVLQVLRADAEALTRMSDRFKQESYDLQQRGWSNLIARDRTERLDLLSRPRRVTAPPQDMMAAVAYAVSAPAGEAPEQARLRQIAFWDAVDYRSEPNGAAGAAQPGESKAIGPMMTLAALRVMNVSQDRPDLIDHLLNLPTAKSCLDFALLHMRQCVAAARFKYEDAFCIAEHQLLDMGECLGATVTTPRRPITPAMAAAPGEPAASVASADTGTN